MMQSAEQIGEAAEIASRTVLVASDYRQHNNKNNSACSWVHVQRDSVLQYWSAATYYEIRSATIGELYHGPWLYAVVVYCSTIDL
eukprot:15048-Heterococcus_DN1.PRE.3